MSLGIYGDGGSMRGSGIYAQDVSYDEFTCENEDCLQVNPAGDTTTDDYGNYEVVCASCGSTYQTRSIEDWRD